MPDPSQAGGLHQLGFLAVPIVIASGAREHIQALSRFDQRADGGRWNHIRSRWLECDIVNPESNGSAPRGGLPVVIFNGTNLVDVGYGRAYGEVQMHPAIGCRVRDLSERQKVPVRIVPRAVGVGGNSKIIIESNSEPAIAFGIEGA